MAVAAAGTACWNDAGAFCGSGSCREEPLGASGGPLGRLGVVPWADGAFWEHTSAAKRISSRRGRAEQCSSSYTTLQQGSSKATAKLQRGCSGAAVDGGVQNSAAAVQSTPAELE